MCHFFVFSFSSLYIYLFLLWVAHFLILLILLVIAIVLGIFIKLHSQKTQKALKMLQDVYYVLVLMKTPQILVRNMEIDGKL